MEETLEEAAERILLETVVDGNNSFDLDKDLKIKEDVVKAMISMAKWQQERSYSEEEVYNILVEHTIELFKGQPCTLNEFFEQFKKK